MADNLLSNKEIAELKRLIKALKEDIDSVSLDRLIQSGDGAKMLLERLRNEFDELNSDISVAANNFNKMVNSASKLVNPINQVSKSFNKLNSIASKIQDHQKGIHELSIDELKQLQKQAQYEKDGLKISAEILGNEKARIQQIIQEAELLANKSNLTDEELRQLDLFYSKSEQYNSELKEINSNLDSINKSITDQNNGYDKLNILLNEAINHTSDYNKLLGIGGTAVEGINASLNKFNLATKDIDKSLRSMSKVNEDLIKNQIKLNQGKLSSKEVDESINKALATRQILMSRLSSLEKQIKDDISTTPEQLNKIKDLNIQIAKITEEVEVNFRKQKEETEKLEKTLGITGKLIKGISKIPILGGIVNTDKALHAAASAAQKGAGSFGAMGAAVKSIGGDIFKNFTDPLTLIVGAAPSFFKLLTESDKATAELAKGMNMTYGDASKLREQYASIARSSEDTYVTIQGLQESQLAIAQTLGSTAKLNEQDLETFTLLRDRAGYTNEELAEMQKLTLAIGGNLEGNVKSFAGTVAKLNLQNKLTINEKQLLKDVSKVSDSIKLSVGGTAEAIATAAFKAKQFGINLEQADKISEGLLNFEESMTNEISAQLLTGKDINLEHARLLALNNDIAGASAEILSQVGSAAEFSDMNRIQQEAIAKAVGLSKDELAKSLVEREALQKIGAKDAEEAAEKYRILRKTMTAEEAAKALKDEAYAKQLEQNAISEDFNKIIQQLKELFIPIAQQLLPKIKELLGPEGGVQSLVKKIQSSFETIKTVVEFIAAVIGVKMVAGLVSSVAQAVKLVSTLGKVNTNMPGGPTGGPTGGGMFSGGIGRLSKVYRGGGVEGLSKSAGRILSKTLKGNALTALLMGGIEAGTNIAEGKGAGESIGRAVITGLTSVLGGAGVALLTGGAGTIAGGIAGGMLGDKIGDMLFGEKKDEIEANVAKVTQQKDGIIDNNGLIVGKYNEGQIQPIAQGLPEDNVIFTTNKPTTIKTSTPISSPNINIDALIKEQQKTNDLLTRLYSKEGVIRYDSDIAGKNANISSYSI